MRKKFFRRMGWLMAIPPLIILLSNLIINSSTQGKTFSNIEEVPANRVGLVLGTSNKLVGGQPNPYYSYRIHAALALFKA
ncbi:MAG: vancomycin high temperature exclusion protein, partial [Flavobacteriaceae bacterium]